MSRTLVISGAVIATVLALSFLSSGPGGCFHPVLRTPTPWPTASPTPPLTPTPLPTVTPTPRHTVLEMQGTSFTINVTPTFLTGVSYYGALADGNEIGEIQEDFDFFLLHGFSWARVWVGWNHITQGGSIWWQGQPILAKVAKLKAMLAYADTHGFIIDLTGAYCDDAWSACYTEPWRTVDQLKAFWEYMAREFIQYRGLYFDIANEHDVQDMRHLDSAQVRYIRDAIKAIDPHRLVTCSGNNISTLADEGLDFFAPHLGRGFEAWRLTCPYLKRTLPLIDGRGIHLQEPFRNGYYSDQYQAADFCRDLQAARECGAMGWCFHTDAGFDMTVRGFRDALDTEESAFIAMIAAGCGAK